MKRLAAVLCLAALVGVALPVHAQSAGGTAAPAGTTADFSDALARLDRDVPVHAEDVPLERALEPVTGTPVLAGAGRAPSAGPVPLRIRPLLTGTILGSVRDAETDEPIPGVNVVIVGTTTGASTDGEGQYRITGVAPGTYAVQASFIGYASQIVEGVTVADGEVTVLDFALETSALGLDEVVVVGYGTVQKRHLTGSVGSIQMDQALESRPVVDFGQAMYGKVPGVQVLNPSGLPGESSRIQIRGVTSLSAGNEPLIVIDGVPLPGFDLNTINATDIASIDILKDAASAAIYGSRGANGVVLVTTKSGGGRPQLAVNYSFSAQSVLNKVDVMSGPEYAQAAIDAAQNGWVDSGGDPNAPNTIEARGQAKYTWPAALENPEALWNTDFQDLIYRVAPMHKADLRFSGGGEDSRYIVSAGIVNQTGIVLKSEYQKYSLHMKADTRLREWLTVGGMINAAYDDETRPHGNVSQGAVQYPSIYPVYGEGGYLGGPNSVSGFEDHYGILFRAYNGHPLHWNSDVDDRQGLNSAGNIFAEFEILPGVIYRSAASAFYTRSDRKFYSPANTGLATTRTARGLGVMSRALHVTLENIVRYDGSWGGHSLQAVAGYEFNRTENYSLEAQRRGYDNDLITYVGAGNLIYDADDGASTSALMSVLSRVSYNYQGRYMLSASFRRDGSSRFGPGNKWGNFPSISAGWRLSDEAFMDRLAFVSNLTLRASYGLTGNDRFGAYRWISAMSQGRVAFGNRLSTTYYPSNIENPDLAWERTRQLNVGIDLGLVEDRFYVEADVYRSESDGLLLDVPVPTTSGFDSVFRNIGALQNTGVDVTFTSHNLTGRFDWTTDVTFGRNRALITKLGPDDAPVHMTRSNMGIVNQVGEAPFSFFAYVYDGVYMNQAEIDAHGVEYAFPVKPGHGRYKDVNADGRINAEDRTIIGNAQPDFTWALNNRFQLGQFDVSVLVHGAVGGDFYFADNRRSLFYHEGRNYLAEMNDRWRSEEQPGDGYHYKLSVDIDGLEKEPSSYWITDGTYTRLKDVTIGFTLPYALASRVGLASARVYLNGTNLFTLQSTSAIDPENSSGSSTDPATIGVQHSPYPTARTYSFGMNLNF